jgi:hypothetical protein
MRTIGEKSHVVHGSIRKEHNLISGTSGEARVSEFVDEALVHIRLPGR